MDVSTSAIRALSVSLLLVGGCEAPLILEHVEAQADKATQRSDQLQAVARNDGTIVVVGNRGVLLTSTDSGRTWERQILDGKPFLMDATTCPDGRFAALAAENQVWISGPDGDSWQASTIDTYETPQALTCDPLGRLWVVGSFSTIFRSDDMGKNWDETSLDEDLHFTTIQFVDNEHGFMTGEFGTVAQTIDGGEAWDFLPPIEGDFYPQDAFFTSRENGWVVGLTGTALRTDDGGQSWQPEFTNTEAPLYGIARRGDSVFVVGGYGTVLERQTSGEWSQLEHGQPIRFYLRGAEILEDGSLITAGGAGALFVISTG